MDRRQKTAINALRQDAIVAAKAATTLFSLEAPDDGELAARKAAAFEAIDMLRTSLSRVSRFVDLAAAPRAPQTQHTA